MQNLQNLKNTISQAIILAKLKALYTFATSFETTNEVRGVA